MRCYLRLLIRLSSFACGDLEQASNDASEVIYLGIVTMLPTVMGLDGLHNVAKSFRRLGVFGSFGTQLFCNSHSLLILAVANKIIDLICDLFSFCEIPRCHRKIWTIVDLAGGRDCEGERMVTR